MKKCPECSRTYSDETLSFCLDDGALLSATSSFWETGAPTAAFGADEVPTFAAREIPTIVNSSSPVQQAQSVGVGLPIYLLGLFISLVVDVVYVYGLYPFYNDATLPIFEKIAVSFDDRYIGFIVAASLLSTPLNLFVYTTLAFLLGYIFPRGKWRWGIISLIPHWAITLYYLIINLSGGNSAPALYIRLIVVNILYLSFACLFANIGARNSSNPAA